MQDGEEKHMQIAERSLRSNFRQNIYIKKHTVMPRNSAMYLAGRVYLFDNGWTGTHVVFTDV
jgi:hypothetical protein